MAFLTEPRLLRNIVERQNKILLKDLMNRKMIQEMRKTKYFPIKIG